MATHIFNLDSLKAEAGESLELEASLVYTASSRSIKARERDAHCCNIAVWRQRWEKGHDTHWV